MNPVSVIMPENGEADCSPTYLFDYSQMYRTDAREAGRRWFGDAAYGLGVHFGLYSLLGKGEDALARGVATPEEYRLLAKRLEAPHFDASDIVEFAIANGMRYVTFSARGADGFSMFGTALSDFNSTRTPARRDFLGELASACEYHGLGLCLQYSHSRDWSRPEGHPASASDGGAGLACLQEYQYFVMGQMKELLTQYGPIAAICLDGVDIPLQASDASAFRCQDLYDYIHHLQPQVLLSYNHGLLGTEDFLTFAEPTAVSADKAKASMRREAQLCLTPGARGYYAERAGGHLREEQVWEALRGTQRARANLLVNTALMPDGSLDYEDIKTLIAVGERIEKGGYPQ